MPQISGLAFSVKFDLTGTPTLVLTDTTSYGVGEAAGITGYFEITLPDGITRTGSYTSPDVTWNGSELPAFEYPLRLNSEQVVQRGVYTITYYADHASYLPTSITRTFTFSYEAIDLVLEENFDVYTPSLTYVDSTNYAVSNYTKTTSTVAWSATIGSVGTTTGSSDTFDLIYGGSYYDAVYTITFQRDLLYTHSSYSWLTITERYTDTISTTADTPPSLAALIACLNDLKTELDAAVDNCTNSASLKARYEYACALHHHLIEKLRVSDNADAEDLVEEFVEVTACAHATNRNQVIPPYTFPSSGSAATPTPYAFIVDANSFIAAGDTTKVITTFIGYDLLFFRNQIKDPTVDTGNSYHSWDKTTGTLTLINGAATTNELFELIAN